jgi:outer membrane protein OmpA-like peptidoglycan-associated protein
MAAYSDDLMADSSVSSRRWLFLAALLSAAVHGVLFYAFSQKALSNFEGSDAPRLVPRAFKVNRLEISQKDLQPEPKKTEKPSNASDQPGAVKNVNQFDGSFEQDMKEVRATPEVTSPAIPGFKEKPSVDAQSAQTAMARAKVESTLATDSELNEVRKQLMDDKPEVANRPKIYAPSRINTGDASSAGGAGIPAGFSNLDELLAGTGKVSGGTAPILMPTDLLFDSNSAVLRPGATASLDKLGRLIQGNPQAVFRVEGHSDSFGTDAYNLDLSRRRAETVKAWLVAGMRIDPSRIQAQGFGKSRLLIPADRSVQEQQLNRRVEIVIKAK